MTINLYSRLPTDLPKIAPESYSFILDLGEPFFFHWHIILGVYQKRLHILDAFSNGMTLPAELRILVPLEQRNVQNLQDPQSLKDQ